MVTNVVYAGTCMTAIQNLIVINPFYDPPTGTTIPWFQSVTITRALAVHSVAGASSQIEGFSADFPSGLTLRDVSLDATGGDRAVREHHPRAHRPRPGRDRGHRHRVPRQPGPAGHALRLPALPGPPLAPAGGPCR